MSFSEIEEILTANWSMQPGCPNCSYPVHLHNICICKNDPSCRLTQPQKGEGAGSISPHKARERGAAVSGYAYGCSGCTQRAYWSQKCRHRWSAEKRGGLFP